MSLYRRYLESGMTHGQDEFGVFKDDDHHESGAYEFISEDEFQQLGRSFKCRHCFPNLFNAIVDPDAAGADEAADSDIVGTTEGTY